MKKLTIILFLAIIQNCFAQNVFKNENLGFSIEQPEKWIVAKNGQTVENLKKNLKFNAETINNLIKQNKGTIEVVSFFKYPTETTPGVIPTIKVNLRKNATKSFNEFEKNITASFDSLQKIFSDFKYEEKATKTKIAGLDCIKAICSYTLDTNNGMERVKIMVYAVPIGDQFYQITFIDSEKEDNSKLYDKLAKSIVID